MTKIPGPLPKEPEPVQSRRTPVPSLAIDVPAVLIQWFRAVKRELPWRGARDPYAIWVSEVMLQQTRVEVVKRYFSAWMRQFPDIRALAAAEVDDVLRVWQGLGYYSRARRLQEGAAFIVREHGGVLPAGQEELRRIPGIGPYSAGAIGSIAYGQRVPAIDGNVVRVACRYWALSGDPTKMPLKRLIAQRVAAWLPPTSVGDFNEALMELGATVCLPRAPLCASCPIRAGCQAFSSGLTASLPTVKERPKPTRVEAVPLILVENGRMLVLRLGDDARWWAGLTVLPTLELGRGSARALEPLSLGLLAEDSVSSAPQAISWIREALGGSVDVELLESVSHTVTRHRLELVPAVVRAGAGTIRKLPIFRGARGKLAWLRASELLREPLAAPYRRIVETYFDKRT